MEESQTCLQTLHGPHIKVKVIPAKKKKERPLSFLAQFNLEDITKYDKDHLLPDKGLLSFFYDLDTQYFGSTTKDKGSARVFWFEDISDLSAMDFHQELCDDLRFPMINIEAYGKISYPS